jgi:heat shock protein HslJ
MKIAFLFCVLATVLSACMPLKEAGGLPHMSPVAPATPAEIPKVQTLEDHRWKLESATDRQSRPIAALEPAPGRSIVLTFSGSRLHLQGGCNQLRGDYQINSEGQMKVGLMASTMMACEPALMQTDSVLAELLSKPVYITLANSTPPVLRLLSANTDLLVLIGQATPEALYGPGTLMFLEIAAQPVACNNPLSGDTVCLQFRERRFDKQGLSVGTPGAWQPLYEKIEGYTHRPGERNVLRVKRFQSSQGKFVYVHDLTVESEVVSR